MSPNGSRSSCPNCGAASCGRYCPDCGQDNARRRLETLPALLEAFQSLVGWDSALLRTLKGLVVDPGGLAADYVAGRRTRYVSPARWCLIALALWLLAARWFELDPLELSGMRMTSTAAEGQAWVDAIRTFLVRQLDLLLFVTLPIGALLYRALFRGRGRNFAECLVLVLYLAGFGYTLGLVVAPLYEFGGQHVLRVRQLIGLVWSVRAARAFFGVGWAGAVWRTALVSLVHVVATAVCFGLIAGAWIWLSE